MKNKIVEEREQLLQKSLEFILHLQLICESITDLPPELARQKIKQTSKTLISLIEPIIKLHFDRMHKTDETLSNGLINELESMVKLIAKGGLQNKVYIAQCLEAHELHPTEAEKAIHSIIIGERD